MLLYYWLSCECLFCLIFSSCEEWIFTSSVPKGLPTLPSLPKLLYFILIFFELLISYFLCHRIINIVLSHVECISRLLPVIIIATLWQLLHLGTLYTLTLCGNSCTWVHYVRLHIAGINEPKIAHG